MYVLDEGSPSHLSSINLDYDIEVTSFLVTGDKQWGKFIVHPIGTDNTTMPECELVLLPKEMVKLYVRIALALGELPPGQFLDLVENIYEDVFGKEKKEHE